MPLLSCTHTTDGGHLFELHSCKSGVKHYTNYSIRVVYSHIKGHIEKNAYADQHRLYVYRNTFRKHSGEDNTEIRIKHDEKAIQLLDNDF